MLKKIPQQSRNIVERELAVSAVLKGGMRRFSPYKMQKSHF
ncbi:hypothetical protein [Pedobacter cryoconitis]|nr:hypothetical protein [Pedobacter cryoconitis]